MHGAVVFLSRASDVRERDFLRNLVSGSERQSLPILGNRQTKRMSRSRGISILLQMTRQRCKWQPKLFYVAKVADFDAMTDTVATIRRRASAEDQKLLDQLASVRGQLAS